MKKAFPLHLPEKSDSQVIAAIQVTLNKYVKRERRKALPEGSNRWDFICRIGTSPEDAESCPLGEIPAHIEALSQTDHEEVYVEILATPTQHTPAPRTNPE